MQKILSLLNRDPTWFGCRPSGRGTSTDQINEEKGQESVLIKIGRETNTRHCLCDPNTKKRKELDIPTCNEIIMRHKFNEFELTPEQKIIIDEEEKKYWPIREKYWLDRILMQQSEKCLFILGKAHLMSFINLLERNGHEYEIINSCWPPNETDEEQDKTQYF